MSDTTTTLRCQCCVCGDCSNAAHAAYAERCPWCYQGDHDYKRPPTAPAMACHYCGVPLHEDDIVEDDGLCGADREEKHYHDAEESAYMFQRELAEEMREDHEATVERPYGIDGSTREMEEERRADWEQARLRGGE